MEEHRRRPPDEVLAWVAHAVSPSARVVSWRRLTGGSPHAAVHRVTVESGGVRHHLVLRRWMPVGLDWTAWTKSAVAGEGAILDGLASTTVPAPRLVAMSDGAETGGRPSLLMTRAPGRLNLRPTDLDGWVREMAVVLARIHAQAVPAPAWRSWVDPASLAVPRWTKRNALWQAAVEAASGAVDAKPGFMHGDYQHFNMLWRRNRMTAVIDWVNAATGPRDVDVGHCRLNLAVLFSAELAERFRRDYEREAGRAVHPRWDITALLSFDERWHDGIPRQVAGRTAVDHAGMDGRVEDLLARAVDRL